MLFLVLFRPFFSVGDLKTHDTWELTYGHWWSTLSDIDKSRLTIYDTNISALSSGREQQKSEQEQRKKLRAEQGLDTEDDQTKKFASFDPFDDMFSPPTSVDGFLTSASPESTLKIPQPDPKTGVGLFALGALLALSTNGALRSKVTSHSDSESDHEENSPDFLVSLTEKSHFSSSSTVKQLQQLINKAKEKSIQSQQQQDQTTQANANSKHQRRSESDTATDDTILLDMIEEFTLNEEQADVFKKVGGAFLSEIRDPKKPPPQVKLTLCS
jgi:TfoX/Sxy family transcriptional regulator of competence genes